MSSVRDYTVTLHANARCDAGEVCKWYWEWWPADMPRLPQRDEPGSQKTQVYGPVNGPTGNQALSVSVSVMPDLPYRWVFCASQNNGATYACAGPHGTFGSTQADPPPDYATFTSAPEKTLAEHWNGSAWSRRRTPIPPGQPSGLSAVSCTSATACTAVGYAGGQTLAERWDGSSWTIQPAPGNSTSGAPQLQGVSCPSATDCTAVGRSPDGHAPLAEGWDGSAWTVEATPNPNPTGADSSLEAVSCASATSCIAVGVSIGYATGNPSDQVLALAEGWNGTTWTIEPTPDPGGGGSLSGVSCTSPTSCTAVGHFGTLAEHWNGSTWSTQDAVSPGQFPSLSSVSCTAANACTAVGNYYNGSRFVTLAERWDGSTWTIQPTPSPGQTDNNLSGVSCVSATSCTAVGIFDDGTLVGEQTLAEHWDGSTWTVQPTPNADPHNDLAGVSCGSANRCVAVGQH